MKKVMRTGLFWFILLQPFLDFYWFYNPPLSEIFSFSLPTILRLVAIGVLMGLYFSQKTSWAVLKKQWWLVAYLLLLVVYAGLHLWHVRHFVSLSPTDYGYTTSGELFYLVRLILPLLVLYLTKYLDFDDHLFTRLVQGLVGIFSGIIVFSNLLVKSLGSYGGWIQANIFNWFSNNKLSFFYLASKGYFNFANTTSAILFMLVPLMAFLVVKSFNWRNVSLLILQGLAMLMLGTKTATYGFAIALVAFVLAYLCHVLILHNWPFSTKVLLFFALIGVGYALIVPHSPAMRRVSLDDRITKHREKSKKPLSETKLNLKLDKQLAKRHTPKARQAYLKHFIGKYYAAYSLNQRFVIKSYPYQRDPEFWYGVMKRPLYERLSNRTIERAMLNRVVATNHNRLDKYLGISFMRMSNIFNLERDFQSQNYSLGLIGTLLFLGVYVLALLYSFVYWLFNAKVRQLATSSLLLANAFLLGAAFYSGNVMDFLTATLLLGFFMGDLLHQVAIGKTAKKLGLTQPNI